MKFKDVDESVYTIEVGEVKIKPYLSAGEIDTITIEMLKQDRQVQREIAKISIITSLCTNMEVPVTKTGINCEETYNMVASNSDLYNALMYEKIVNVDVIDDIIKKTESTYKIAEDFITNLSKALEGFDVSKIQDSFTGLGDKIDGRS